MYKILLCCASGVTTNMLVNSMKQAAKEENMNVVIWSATEAALSLSWADADCILVAPQKKELLKQVRTMVNGSIPVEIINDEDFITMNGKATLYKRIGLINKV